MGPRIHLVVRQLSTVGDVEKVFATHEDCRRIAVFGEVTLVCVTRLWNLRWKHDWTSVAGQAKRVKPSLVHSKVWNVLWNRSNRDLI